MTGSASFFGEKLILNPFKNKGSFFTQVSTLAGGTTIAHLITVVFAPVLTRLYTPEQMGAVAGVIAVVSVISVLAAGGYDLAIVLPDTEPEALALTSFGFVFLTGVTLVLTGIAGIWGKTLAPLVGLAGAAWPWVFCIPAITLTAGIQGLLTQLFVRTHQFRALAATTILQQSATSAVKIGLGLGRFGLGGLFLGTLAGHVLRAGLLVRNTLPLIRRYRPALSWPQLWTQARRYKKFPLFSSGSGFLNALSSQMPILLFASLFSPLVVGHYALSHNILRMPLGLVGRNVAYVFLNRAARARLNPPELARISLALHEHLLFLGVVLLSFVTFYGRWLFPVVFGSEWAEAGRYAQWISVWLIFEFAATPLSSLFSALERQKEGLAWNVGLLIIRAAIIFHGYAFQMSALSVIAEFSVISAVSAVLLSLRVLALAGVALAQALWRTTLFLVPPMAIQYAVFLAIRSHLP